MFEWRFDERHGADTYVFQMALDQAIDFDSDWTDTRTEENMIKLQQAVRSVQNTALLQNPSDDEVETSRQQLGETVDRHASIDQVDDVNLHVDAGNQANTMLTGQDRGSSGGDQADAEEAA